MACSYPSLCGHYSLGSDPSLADIRAHFILYLEVSFYYYLFPFYFLFIICAVVVIVRSSICIGIPIRISICRRGRSSRFVITLLLIYEFMWCERCEEWVMNAWWMAWWICDECMMNMWCMINMWCMMNMWWMAWWMYDECMMNVWWICDEYVMNVWARWMHVHTYWGRIAKELMSGP